MDYKEKFNEVKKMSETLSEFISENESAPLRIKEKLVIDFLYNNLKPVLGDL